LSDVKIVLNGKEVFARDGMTILQAAQQEGIEIPTLCHSPDLTPAGICRLCIVQIEGTRALIGSCHTPIAEGMIIHTHSAKVLAARKVIVELLMTSHCGSCVIDANARNCQLHKLASDLEVGPPRFQVASYVADVRGPVMR
jgi:NADH dehydrogenase/NADH:ubiquinone oxidoreductase subunit G